MRIKCGYEISYQCSHPTPMLLLLSVHPSRRGDLETPDTLRTEPALPKSRFVDLYGNHCTRIVAPAGITTLRSEFVIRDSGRPDAYAPDAPQLPVEDLPHDALFYLMGSRYCEVDQLTGLAWSLFGGVTPGWERVQAIVDYAHDRISFDYQRADKTRTAWRAHEERVGVCRDYAHLAVTLCRAMNIPARYCTGYLGDIGVPPMDAPMDFSAWFEVFLGDRWYTFDARHNEARIGRVLIARGRDATDVAISTEFGNALLAGFKVITEELEERPMRRDAGTGIEHQMTL
jgi:transglutaminase-like putative cysteine protease